MRTLGNVLWHVPFLGFVSATITYLVGALLMLIGITAPIGLGLMAYGKFLFAPFSYAMVSKKELHINQNKYWDLFSKILMILYLPLGVILVVLQVFSAAVAALTIVGIPVALVIAKSLGTCLNPVNKVCVHRAVREELDRRQAQVAVNKALAH